MTNPLRWLLPLTLFATACGGSSGVANPLNTGNLSSAEISAVASALSSAAGNVSSSAQANVLPANSDVLPAANSDIIVPPASANTISVPVNRSIACPMGGHVTSTGNIVTTYSTTDWSVYGAIAFNYGDRTNNLNDCKVAENVVLDGTLNFTMSGNKTSGGIGWSLNGNIEVDQPTSSGGLSPRGSCFVSINFPKGGTRATGTVCGESI